MATITPTGINTVEIFPSTKTKTMNKLITENSLTRLLNRLMDVDGYIISSEISTDISNDYDYVTVDSTFTNTNLEICIRGYYFNLGKFPNVINTIRTSLSPTDGQTITACIFIDKSNPDFPELYGQDTFTPADDITVTQSTPNPVFEDGCDVSTITFYDTDGEKITSITDFHLNDSNKLVDSSNNLIDLYTAGVVTVKYYIRTEEDCVWLYVSNEGDTITPPIEGLTRFDLDLFEAVSDGGSGVNFKIPVSSFHKFSSVSIQTIDGGRIDEPTS